MKKEISALTKAILEGADIRSTLAQKPKVVTQISEAVLVSASNLDEFYKTSYYRNLSKMAGKLLYKVENDDDYRKGVWAKDPLTAVHDEVDEFFYALEHLKQLKLEGFDEDAVKKANAILATANRSYRRVLIKLDQNDTPEKVVKAFQPLFYAKKALTLYTDFFSTLGIAWDYVWPWYNTDKEVNVKDMAFEEIRKYFDWLCGLYERYSIEKVDELVAEKRASLTEESIISAFEEAQSYLK